MKPPMDCPWAVARFRPDGSYLTLATFPDRETAVDVATENVGAVLFRSTRQCPKRRHDDF